jgi:hypothetical protein
MSDSCQFTYVGAQITIHCDDRWGCCQRAQAKQKAEKMNEILKSKPHKVKDTLSTVMVKAPGALGFPVEISIKDAKEQFCEWERNAINKAPNKADEFERRGAAPCLVAQMRAGNPKGIKTENDHPLDCKLCGAWNAPLIPTDAAVNGAFGSAALNTIPAGSPVEEIVLVCPPTPPGCDSPPNPAAGHSVGTPSPNPPQGASSYTRQASTMVVH